MNEEVLAHGGLSRQQQTKKKPTLLLGLWVLSNCTYGQYGYVIYYIIVPTLNLFPKDLRVSLLE